MKFTALQYISSITTLFYGLTILLLLSSCGGDNLRPSVERSFNNGWEFSEAGEVDWLRASVPGAVQLDLIRYGLLEDPRIDSNEFSAQWVEVKDWIYRKKFLKSDLPERNMIQFDFEGLDTYCDVFLNDSLVGQSENMFLPLNIYMRYADLLDENVLELRFKSTLNQGVASKGARLHGLTAGNDRTEERVSPYVRKAPYQFGWDWAPRLLTTGIWKDVVLRAQDEFFDISTGYQYIITEDDMVRGFVHLEYCWPEHEYKVIAKGPWGTMTDSIKYASCPTSILFDFEIPDADLWSIDKSSHSSTPVDILIYNGDDLIHTEHMDMAFRDIELHQEEDSIGTAFYFTINGEPRFIKGANYIPQSLFPSEVSDEDYRRLLSQVKESNIDMLRVWGGGIYEKDIFYELCDSLGILVWQDLMFAGAMYPTDDSFLHSVKQEVSHQYERLKDHPCIVLWCGNNEVDVAWKNWGWQGMLGIDSAQAQQDYDLLFDQTIGEELNEEPYVHSSPLSNWGTPENFNHHNMHYWGVWHGDDDFKGFEGNVPRFMSEYGFQSFPMPATFEGEVDPSEWQIESPSMRHRQKSYKGTKELERHLDQHYPKTDNFERFCYLSQLNQALAMEMAINAHRGSNGHCMGSLYWQLNDVWAAPSWSTIDVKGNWKAAHYAVQDRYKDIVVLTRSLEEALDIIVVNDRAEDLTAQLEILHMDFSGEILSEQEISVSLSARTKRSVHGLTLEELNLSPELKRTSLLRISLRENGELLDEWLHYFVEPKDLKLEPLTPQDIAIEVLGEGEYRLTASKFCKDVFFYLPQETGARWSDNCLDLFPGQSRTIRYLGDRINGDIRLLSLNGTSDALR